MIMKGAHDMTLEQIIGELKKHDPEWIHLFVELAKIYVEATPEHRKMLLDSLKNGD